MTDTNMFSPIDEDGLPIEGPRSKRRLIVAGVAALAALVVIGAAVGLFVFRSGIGPAPQVATAADSPATTSEPAGDEAPTAISAVLPKDAKPLSSSFTFRDIFVPTVKPKKTADTSNTTTNTGSNSGSTTTTSTVTSSNTLELKSVTTENGKEVATFLWNGKTFKAGAGEALAGTPWKVLSISGETVVMLYGDTRISLTVGQGITK